MGRYRKVDPRMWGDEKFCQLSPIPPCGQGLWVWLLTNKRATMIPGLFESGELGMAEDIGWPAEAFREAFREALTEGMVRFDRRARVVWLPNAIRYNEPESPNVVKSWTTWWDEIPECELKAEAWRVLKAFLEAKGKAFGEAFRKACRKPSPKARANQEQEQEQYQEQEQEQDPAPTARSNGTVSTLERLNEYLFTAYNSLPNKPELRASLRSLLPATKTEIDAARDVTARDADVPGWAFFTTVLASSREKARGKTIEKVPEPGSAASFRLALEEDRRRAAERGEDG